jgi:hypothetical protein
MDAHTEKTREFLCFLDSRCKGGWDAYSLRMLFKGLVEAHWEDGLNHGRYSSKLSCFKLSDKVAEGQTRLVVKIPYETDPNNPEPIPRIEVHVGGLTFEKRVLGNVSSAEGNRSPGKEDINHTLTSWQANHDVVLVHIFENPETALLAAQSTLEFFAGVSGDLRDTCGFGLFEPIGCTAVKQVTKDPSAYFQVDVGLKLQYDFTVAINLESHRLKVLAADLST